MNIQDYCQKNKVSRDKAEFELREKEVHKVDIAQPGSELWDKAWAGKAKKRQEMKEKREKQRQDERSLLEEREGVSKRRIYI